MVGSFQSSILRAPIKTNSYLTLRHLKYNEYILEINANLIPIEGFVAGHGMDMTSMKRILSEPIPDNHPRKEDPTNADIGEHDTKWVNTWNMNLSVFSTKMLMQALNNKTP